MPLAVFIVHYHTTFRILGGWKMFLLYPHSSPYSTSVFCLKAFDGFYSVNKLHTQVWDKSFETWKQYGSNILPDETSTVQTTVTVMYTTCLKWLPYSPDDNFLLFWSVSLCCYQSHIISALTDVHFNNLKYFYHQKGATPLVVASEEGHLPVVERLIAVKADVSHQTKVHPMLLITCTFITVSCTTTQVTCYVHCFYTRLLIVLT